MTGIVMVTRGGGCGGGGRKGERSKCSVREEEEEDQNQLSLVDVVLAALRKSMVYCKADQREEIMSSVQQMEIGWPTNVKHIAHVTFDRFNGFLGLPVEFEVEVPSSVPSASASVFGVSAESMQCSTDSKGNSVPTLLLLMQDRLYRQGGLKAEGIFRINPENSQEEQVRDKLNRGIIPENIDVHCLAGLIKAWFRELPSGVLDGLSPEQVLQCNTEEESVELVKQLKPTEAALLNWAIDLMADVVEEEDYNKMNARNIAMVFAPNMTQMSDPLTALMHAVQVMNLLKMLIMKTLREREETASGGYSPVSSHSSDQQMNENSDSQQDMDTSDESRGPNSDVEDDDIQYNHSSEDGDGDEGSLSDIEDCFLRQLNETKHGTCRSSEQQEGDFDIELSSRSCSGFNFESSISFTDSKNGNSCLSTSDGEDSGTSSREEDKKIHNEVFKCKNPADIMMDDKMREYVSSMPAVAASSESV